jgi:hypothetical protein
MKEALNAMVQAIGDQAIALGTVSDRLTALKQTLARQFPDMADELKSQIEADQEKSRTENYELQVSLAKLREAITRLAEKEVSPEVKVEKKRGLTKARARAAGESDRSQSK